MGKENLKKMKSGPIIIIEDDIDDKDILTEVFRELNVENKQVWFTDCLQAWDYLKTTTEQPFVIFCDVNLPKLSGMDFKRQIDADPQLRKKSIPFLFYSTSIEQNIVNEAYTQMTVQGFFKKGDNYQEIRQTMKSIIEYWQTCKHPNTL